MAGLPTRERLPSYRTEELGIFISMNRRGFVLTFAMVASLLFAILCMALIAMVTGETRRARFHQLRDQALYASEAGIAWAQGELQSDPCWGSNGQSQSKIIGVVNVSVAVDACVTCPGVPCSPRGIRTQVTF